MRKRKQSKQQRKSRGNYLAMGFVGKVADFIH